MIDRTKIEALVRQALVERQAQAPGPTAAPGELDSGGALVIPPDRGAAHEVAEVRRLREATPARIAVGRAGSRYRTATLLRFRADHAAAKDAVLSEVDPALLARLGIAELRSAAADKREFLVRPDLGRRLSDESRAKLGELPRRGQLLLVYGDGLSAAALNENLAVFHEALLRALGAAGIRVAGPVFVRYSRVKVMDELADRTEAEAAVFVCGERPGLGFADSLSAYYMYRKPSGATDADREVISNINQRGLPPAEAAGRLAEACARVLRDRRSGVVLG